MMRLDKFLAEFRSLTRSEAKKRIRAGRVSVNGNPAASPEQKVDETGDSVLLDGEQLCYEPYRYYLFCKPAGCVTANTDKLHRTVMDYFPESERKSLRAVGRLDLDTEGLLLVTDDGAFNHALASPAHHVAKRYYARLDNPVPEGAAEAFAEGIDIGDETRTRPAQLEILPDEKNEDGTAAYPAVLTVTEGRYHQVKRMFQAVGCRVVYLKRIAIGELTADDLKPGEYRRLTEAEYERIYHTKK